MIKKFFYIFIPVLAVLLMSHNAAAITPVLDINNYSLKHNIPYTNLNCGINGGANNVTSGNSYCQTQISGDTSLYSISTANTYNIKNGDIVNFYLLVYSNTEGISYLPKIRNINISSWQVLDIQTVDKETYFEELYSTGGYINWPPNNDFGIDFKNNSGFYRLYEYTLRASADMTNVSFGLTGNAISPLFVFNANDMGNIIRFSIQRIYHFEYVGSEDNREVEEKTQDASNNSATSGSNSSSNSQTATSSLLSVITSGIGAITSASPTNCKINGNMGNLNVGNIDLCANPVPTFMALIGSIIAVLVVLPLVIVLFNRFISIIRSFQK